MEYTSIIYRGQNEMIATSTLEYLKKAMDEKIPIPVEGGPNTLVKRYLYTQDAMTMDYIVKAIFDIPCPADVQVSMEIVSERKLKISETYVLGVDIDENIDESAVSIGRAEMGKIYIVKTIHGKEAVEFYNKLIEQEKNK